jgi:hypothetical protein
MEFYLDTNAINYLFEHACYSNAELADIRARLKRKVELREMSVLVDDILLSELVDAAPTRPTKFQNMSDYLLNLVGQNWLLHIHERVKNELAFKRRLYNQERLRSDLNPSDLATPSPHDTAVREETNKNYSRKNQYRLDVESAKADFLAQFGLQQLRSDMRDWWANPEQVIDRYVTFHFERDHENLGLRPWPSSWPNPRMAFSLWNVTAFFLARIYLNLAEGASIQPSDFNDATHYSAASYSDIMITDDIAFSKTYDKTPSPLFKIKNFASFVSHITS